MQITEDERMVMDVFSFAFRGMSCLSNDIAHEHGWWCGVDVNSPHIQAEKLCLMHSEISEALEAIRAGNDESSIIPPHSELTEELADLVIRVMDFSQQMGLDLGAAIGAKTVVNNNRPHKHGKVL